MSSTDDSTADEMKAAAAAFERLFREQLHLGLEITKRQRLDFLPHAEAKRKREQVFDLRDSIRHRAHSLLWHLRWLHQRRAAVRMRSKETFIAELDSGGDPGPALQYIRMQYYLLDDVIFNMLSLFDYIGNLVGTLRLNAPRLYWAQVAKRCRKNPNPLNPTLVTLIVTANDRWVDGIQRFRGKLIHHEATLGQGASSLDLNTLSANWHAWLPGELKAHLPSPLSSSTEPVDVVEGATALVERTLDCTAEIVHAVWDSYPWGRAPWEKQGKGLPP